MRKVREKMKWSGEKVKCNENLRLEADDRNEGMEDSDEYTDEEEYEEDYHAEQIVVWTQFVLIVNWQGVAPEDQELFNTFGNSGQSRNLADLITAKLAAHENRVQFADEPSEPRRPPLPPKVIEVYKK